MLNLDLNEYEFEEVVSIETHEAKREKRFIDITVEDNHTFFMVGSDDKLFLSHNCDAQHIKALLLNIFYKYWKGLFDLDMICIFDTPLVKVIHKKKTLYFYTYTEFEEWSALHKNESYTHKHLKGLGSSKSDDWKTYFSSDVMNKCVRNVSLLDDDIKYFELLFSKKCADKRKDWLDLEDKI